MAPTGTLEVPPQFSLGKRFEIGFCERHLLCVGIAVCSRLILLVVFPGMCQLSIAIDVHVRIRVLQRQQMVLVMVVVDSVVYWV